MEEKDLPLADEVTIQNVNEKALIVAVTNCKS